MTKEINKNETVYAVDQAIAHEAKRVEMEDQNGLNKANQANSEVGLGKILIQELIQLFTRNDQGITQSETPYFPEVEAQEVLNAVEVNLHVENEKDLFAVHSHVCRNNIDVSEVTFDPEFKAQADNILNLVGDGSLRDSSAPDEDIRETIQKNISATNSLKKRLDYAL